MDANTFAPSISEILYSAQYVRYIFLTNYENVCPHLYPQVSSLEFCFVVLIGVNKIDVIHDITEANHLGNGANLQYV